MSSSINSSLSKKSADSLAMNSSDLNKSEPRNFNARLKSYFEWVRRLEERNTRLHEEMATRKEVHIQEIASMCSSYDEDLSSTRSSLDQCAKEKASLEMVVENARFEIMNIELKMKDKDEEISILDSSNIHLHSQNSGLRKQAQSADDELGLFKYDFYAVKKNLEDTREKLEAETVGRIDIQNKILTVQEERSFNQTILESKRSEINLQSEREKNEIMKKYEKKYEEKIKNEEEKLKVASHDGESSLHKKKISELEEKLAKACDVTESALFNKNEMQIRSESLSRTVVELEKENSDISRRVNILVFQIEELGRENRSDLALKNSHLDFMKEKIDEATKDLTDLTEMKEALDAEISSYQNQMEEEELRFGQSTAGRKTKKRRLDNGDISGEETDPRGV